MRELHHDFRLYYHCKYEDVPTEEAIDLISSLGMGTHYRAYSYPDMAWDHERYQMANVIDFLNVINWRLMGCPEDLAPEPVSRPGDARRHDMKVRDAESVRERLMKTEWKDA